jgi:uncharacterized SAM-binding protein YcdF (DUF218 family)
MPKIEKITAAIVKAMRILLITLGVMFLIVIFLAMTSLPFWTRFRLGNSEAFVPDNTQTIVIMGAGGFPSETLLIRLWYTADLATKLPGAKVVITTPGDTLDPKSTISQMATTLISWGVDRSRIINENKGLNTRHQAMMVKELKDLGTIAEPVVIVTSPEHIYRSVVCFEKVGFYKVSGYPASEVILETDLRIRSKNLGGNAIVPDFGNSISIRYKFWEYLKYEIIVLREYMAITYYWFSGWI